MIVVADARPVVAFPSEVLWVVGATIGVIILAIVAGAIVDFRNKRRERQSERRGFEVKLTGRQPAGKDEKDDIQNHRSD